MYVCIDITHISCLPRIESEVEEEVHIGVLLGDVAVAAWLLVTLPQALAQPTELVLALDAFAKARTALIAQTRGCALSHRGY